MNRGNTDHQSQGRLTSGKYNSCNTVAMFKAGRTWEAEAGRPPVRKQQELVMHTRVKCKRHGRMIPCCCISGTTHLRRRDGTLASPSTPLPCSSHATKAVLHGRLKPCSQLEVQLCPALDHSFCVLTRKKLFPDYTSVVLVSC